MTLRLRSPSLFWTFAACFLGAAVLATLFQGVVVIDLLRTLATRSSGLDGVVRRAADEIAAELTRSPDRDISVILTAHQRHLDAAMLAFRDSTGRLPFGGRMQPGRHEPPPRGLAVSQKVVVGGRTVGEVVAWELAPPEPGKIGPMMRFLGSLPLALLLATAAGLVMFRNVLGRLRALQSLAGRVAEGDLDVRVPEPGADEIGQVGLALNRMTEKLAAAKRVIDASDHERRQLFADISHELATPLTSIRGYAETLLNPSIALCSEERERYLRHIHAASQRMDLLIQDLLELTRLEAGAVGLVEEPIDWAALCRNTVEAFVPRFAEAGLRLVWNGAPAEAWILADGRRMEQVIDNLLVNALHYVPRGHTIWVSLLPVVEAATTTHRLVVEDDGAGFPAQDLPLVFDRFYRGVNASSTSGSGLGLAIVQEILRRHRGRVHAANRHPSGAAITVDLPAADVSRPGRSASGG